MALPRDYDGQACALARSLEVVGERWTLLILRDLFFGVRRFSDLQVHLDIPRAVLSARLTRLVETGIVERRPYGPGRTSTCSRTRGTGAVAHRPRLMQWGERHLVADGPVRLFAHATCGTELAHDGTCPACGIEPAPADVETRPGPGVPTVVRARSDQPRAAPTASAAEAGRGVVPAAESSPHSGGPGSPLPAHGTRTRIANTTAGAVHRQRRPCLPPGYRRNFRPRVLADGLLVGKLAAAGLRLEDGA